MDEQVDRRAREHQEMDTWKYYDACHALSPLSSGSLGGHGSLELSALGRARAHLHTYTHTLTRRGCTYIALLCNDGNFFSLTHTHPHTMHLSLSPLSHQEWQFLGYEAHRSVSPSFTNSGVTALAFLSHRNKRRNGRSERKQKALFLWAGDQWR